MQPNYEAEARRRQQQQYQQTRNPFELGQQVAQRRYSEIMSGLDNQMRETQRSYGDMYQAARQRAVGAQAMGGPTLSGGMGQQRRDFVSALEMQELGKIGSAQQQALADIAQQRQSAFSNAQLEGQQATQMELQNQQAKLNLVNQTQAILKDENLSKAQREEQLEALGVDPSKFETKAAAGFLGWNRALSKGATSADVWTAVGKTALAAGAVFVFGPLVYKMLAGGAAKLLGVGAAGKGSLFGWAGWKGIFGTTMKTAGSVGPYTPFVAGASKGATFLQPIINSSMFPAAATTAAKTAAATTAATPFYDYVFNAAGQAQRYIPPISI